MIRSKSITTIAVIAFGCLGSAIAQQVPGMWVNVTPAGAITAHADLGATTVLCDPVRPADIYANFQHNGTWKSTDYGLTWIKVSTGLNSTDVSSGAQWHAMIDQNPARDPSTPPTMYTVQGYGALGIWKTTNGGVDWVDVWKNNVYKADGVTNVYADVGRDMMGISSLSSYNANHILTYPHGYNGTGGNSGLYRTDDGGGKWTYIPCPFNFQPHSDAVWAIDSTTWIATLSAPWPVGTILRSTNQGVTWDSARGTFSNGLGYNSWCKTGSTIYAGSDFRGGVYKTTDKGATWSQVPAKHGAVGWVAVTATMLYAVGNYEGVAKHPVIMRSPLTSDTAWKYDTLGEMGYGCYNPGVTFDGSHYVMVAAFALGGIWRYVEPSTRPYMVLTDSLVDIAYDLGQAKPIKTATVAVVNRMPAHPYSGLVTVTNKRAWLSTSVNATNPDSQVITNTIDPATIPDVQQKYYDTVTVHTASADVVDLTYQVVVWVRPAEILTSIVMTPHGTGTLPSTRPIAFTAATLNQYDLPMAQTATWTATGGSVSNNGLFSPTASDDTARIIVNAGSFSDTAKAYILPCSQGLNLDYYAHVWVTAVSEIASMTPTQSVTKANITVTPISGQPQDSFALRYTGFIRIPVTGSYTFYTLSDDGSALFIDGNKVVDNDLHHGPTEVGGTVTLGWGLHTLSVLYFEEGGGQNLAVRWEGPGVAKSLVPDSLLFRTSGTSDLKLAGFAASKSIQRSISLTKSGLSVSVNSGESWTLDLFTLKGTKIAACAATGPAVVGSITAKTANGFLIARLKTRGMATVERVIYR